MLGTSNRQQKGGSMTKPQERILQKCYA